VKLLSVVIPTRNRARFLGELLTCLIDEVLAAGCRDEVEIVCSDNCSSDDTAAVANRFVQHHPFVRYCRQPKNLETAEESMFASVAFAAGEYVWTMGDDDLLFPGALAEVLKTLRAGKFSYLLLNCAVTDYENGVEALYFAESVGEIAYASTQDLFHEIGFVTHTTSISCLCFRRALFDEQLCRQFAELSPIYSHSFALFTLYRSEPACVISTPIVRFRMSWAADELASHVSYQTSLGHPSYWSFHLGLMRLMLLACERSGISLEWFAGVQELEFSRFAMAVTPMRFRTVLFRAVLQQARLYLETSLSRERINEEEFALLAHFFASSDLSGHLAFLRSVFADESSNAKSPLRRKAAFLKLSQIEGIFLLKEARHIARLQPKLFTAGTSQVESVAGMAGRERGKGLSLIAEVHQLVRNRGMASFLARFFNMMNGTRVALLILKLVCHFKGFLPNRLTRI